MNQPGDSYEPATAPGRLLLAHELVHSVQQGYPADPQPAGDSSLALQRGEDENPITFDAPAREETTLHGKYKAGANDDLRNNLSDLVDTNVTDYVTYRNMIAKSTAAEKRAALNTVLLAKIRDRLGLLALARCVEALGRGSPTFDQLRKNSVVVEAITNAWKASDVGARDLVTEPHEEGGWVFMNLIDGKLSIERAKAEGTDFIRVEPPPDVEDSVLVAIFHTHPHLGRTGKPSRHDIAQDQRRGVPNLVAGNLGTKPDEFQIFLSGPAFRKHLASDTKIPGPSGGFAP